MTSGPRWDSRKIILVKAQSGLPRSGIRLYDLVKEWSGNSNSIAKTAGVEELVVALQGNSLWMTALGLAAPDQIEEGVHLRWSVSASVGFPPLGFDLYRRRHVPSPAFCMVTGDAVEDTTHFSSGDLAVDSDLPLNWRPKWGPSTQPVVVVDDAA